MLIDIKKIFTEEVKSLRASGEFSMADFDISGHFPFVSPVSVDAVISAYSGAAKLEADVSYVFSMPCDRCAEPITETRSQHFSHVLVRNVENGDFGAYVIVGNDVLELDELIYSDIVLELPMKFLCKEDCLGLCPKCGKNLNKGSCMCDLREIDPRLELLKSLID